MDAGTIKTILNVGETIAVEFKRCGNGIESDVYETVFTNSDKGKYKGKKIL